MRTVGIAVAVVAAGMMVATGSASAGVTGGGQQSPLASVGRGLTGSAVPGSTESVVVASSW